MARLMLFIAYERRRVHHVTGLARKTAAGAGAFERGALALKQFKARTGA